MSTEIAVVQKELLQNLYNFGRALHGARRGLRRAIFRFENDSFALLGVVEGNQNAIALLYRKRTNKPTGFAV